MFGYLAAEIYRPKPSEGVFVEPSDGTLQYRPWGAVPANLDTHNKPLLERQRFIDLSLEMPFDHPPAGVPGQFSLMLKHDHMGGEARRKLKNSEGFQDWTKLREPVTVELNDQISHVEHGTALPGDSLDFAIHTKVENFEVGKVTHPYGVRLEHVEPFREEVEEALLERGGVVYPKVFAYHSIAITPGVECHEDGTHTLNGFIVRYKRDFGAIDSADGSSRIRLVERQLAGIRVDPESGFDQQILERMLAHKLENEESWRQHYMEYVVDTSARGFIERAIQTDSTADYFVPISTTIYGFKEPYATPTTKGLARAAFASDGGDGMAYFGPKYMPSKIPIPVYSPESDHGE